MLGQPPRLPATLAPATIGYRLEVVGGARLKSHIALSTLLVAPLVCGCALGAMGDNLDPHTPHRAGHGYAVVFTSIAIEGPETVGLEVFHLRDDGPGARREIVLVADRGTELAAAYLPPGKYEIGGIVFESGRGRSAALPRRQRDAYAYFRITEGACNWIGDYAVDAGATGGSQVTQLVDERSFAATGRAFGERFPDLAARCNLKSALVTR